LARTYFIHSCLCIIRFVPLNGLKRVFDVQDFLTPVLCIASGIAVGGVAVYIYMSSKLSQALQDNARLGAENQALADQSAQQTRNIDALEKKFSLQFENLAHKIFHEKSQTFKLEAQENLGHILSPLRDKLTEFQKKVDDSAKEQFSLKNEIKNIIDMNAKMTLQTENLTRALKGDVKAQGNWGEIALEKILEESGLRKGIDYILQGTDLGLRHVEDGSILKPDVVVMLPEDKHVIVDAKVSLTAYERYCAAQDDSARALHLKEYLASVRAHVQGLETRRYQDTPKLGTPDFVLMFMPIEGAYSLAVQQDAGLHGFAWDKKIVIVCPSTLFATLKTVASVWRLEMQNKNAIEIARQGGNLYDKIASFVEDMQDIGARIAASQKSYDDAFKKLSTGQGNILKRAEDIRKLGIKTSKKISKDALEDDDTPVKIAENG
jgi:DNA recombination protein RmuC